MRYEPDDTAEDERLAIQILAGRRETIVAGEPCLTAVSPQVDGETAVGGCQGFEYVIHCYHCGALGRRPWDDTEGAAAPRRGDASR